MGQRGMRVGRWGRRGGARQEEADRTRTFADDGLRGRRIVVTGGGGGIGSAVAAALVDAGTSVMLVDRDAAALAAATADLTGRGATVASCVASVDDEADVARMVDATEAELGGIDGLVTAAGIARAALALECTRAQFDRMIAVNLTGTFLCSTAVARHLVACGASGSIVTIASTLANSGEWMFSHYAASKAGVVALTKNFALEWGGHGIRVNCVAPGLVDSPMNATLPEEQRAKYVQQSPLGRTGVPADVAKAVRYLLSDDAGYVTGQTLVVNGGHTMPS